MTNKRRRKKNKRISIRTQMRTLIEIIRKFKTSIFRSDIFYCLSYRIDMHNEITRFFLTHCSTGIQSEIID